ncbi:MAG: hypothetical protein KF833_00670 [Verrucomicrobiae bacterium]|nr:hypothetical protein [Verrucomicrobiae bacterium]
MSAPDQPSRYGHLRKGTWVVGAVLVTAAVSGYFMGLRQTGSALNRGEPATFSTADAVRPEGAGEPQAPVAVAYSRQDWLRDGPNAGWESHLARLVQPSFEPADVQAVSEADRERARRDRAARRAFDGAPPTVPHPIVQDSVTACLACHGEGMAVKDRFASRMSHPVYPNCTQCHVSEAGLGMAFPMAAMDEPLAGNGFIGASAPRRGTRAWPEAPPTIPHPTRMREDCMSCHGPFGAFALRTPHPERQACTQCHVPDAGLEAYPFLLGVTAGPGSGLLTGIPGGAAP